MATFRIALHVFLYVVVVFPLAEVVSQVHERRFSDHAVPEDHHHHAPAPCDSCPRRGRCVPRVQCPAHVRPGAASPTCHLGRGRVGVCCSTGQGHAAESDLRLRESTSIHPEELKRAHRKSRRKLDEWLRRAERLLDVPGAVLQESSPGFGHHMSVRTYDPNAQKLGEGGLLNLLAAEELRARDAVSDDQLRLGLTGHADGPFCPPTPSCPPQGVFRSAGGECNNPGAPLWGAAHTGFERLLPPDYSDGLWSLRTARSGAPLPSARRVSAALVPDGSHPSPTHSLMFMQFGQFLAHDVSAGVVFGIGNGSALSCCTADGDFLPPEFSHFACAAVAAPPDDPFFGPFAQQCLNFVRTQLAPAADCAVGYARPMNGVTHHIDLSHIYGSSPERMSALRGPRGRQASFNDFGRELPPLTQRSECLSTGAGAPCFESGDNHANQIISLTALHTLWTREHNRVAGSLAALNPGWSDDLLYLHTRRILQATFQHIVYREWLPMLLGPEMVHTFDLAPAPGYSSSYDPRVNPSLTAEFSAAAMRFGHSTVDSKLMIPNAATGALYEAVSIPEVMFQPSRLRLRPFLDRLVSGLTRQPMQSVDPFVTESLTRYLFHGGNPFGLDLATINVQRGRDYGLRPHGDYRRLVGLPPAEPGQLADSVAKRLSQVYESPEDVDLWVGGLLEEPVPGGIVGPTFANIIADQFSRIKRGDRYFYEHGPDANPGAFTPGQLAEIKKVTLARILCDNKDGVELTAVSPNAFLRADLPGNAPVSCDGPIIPFMDLNSFREV